MGRKLLNAIREHKMALKQSINDASNEFDQYDAMSHLPLLQAFLHECLRLHPPAPADGKEAIKDDTLPDGTFVCISTVPRYCTISISIIDGRYWMGWDGMYDCFLFH